jgi:hypothetical protein
MPGNLVGLCGSGGSGPLSGPVRGAGRRAGRAVGRTLSPAPNEGDEPEPARSRAGLRRAEQPLQEPGLARPGGQQHLPGHLPGGIPQRQCDNHDIVQWADDGQELRDQVLHPQHQHPAAHHALAPDATITVNLLDPNTSGSATDVPVDMERLASLLRTERGRSSPAPGPLVWLDIQDGRITSFREQFQS